MAAKRFPYSFLPHPPATDARRLAALIPSGALPRQAECLTLLDLHLTHRSDE
jgi:hypothetical protein